MTGTNHGMTGAVIALLVREPLLAIPLSVASHIACDTIPHFGVRNDELFTKKFNIILVSDFIIAVSLMILLGFMFPAQKWLIWACMIAAASPDLLWAYYHLYLQKLKQQKPKLDVFSRLHAWVQWSQTYPGAGVEVIWFIVMGALIFARR